MEVALFMPINVVCPRVNELIGGTGKRAGMWPQRLKESGRRDGSNILIKVEEVDNG